MAKSAVKGEDCSIFSNVSELCLPILDQKGVGFDHEKIVSCTSLRASLKKEELICRTLACAAQSPCHSVQTRLFRECSLHPGQSSSFSLRAVVRWQPHGRVLACDAVDGQMQFKAQVPLLRSCRALPIQAQQRASKRCESKVFRSPCAKCNCGFTPGIS